MLVDVDVPWFPRDVQPNETTFWAHIDVDVLKPGSPMWTFPGNLRLQGDSGRILEQVLEALKAKRRRASQRPPRRACKRIEAAREERLPAPRSSRLTRASPAPSIRII